MSTGTEEGSANEAIARSCSGSLVFLYCSTSGATACLSLSLTSCRTASLDSRGSSSFLIHV